jgi:hypothetical protein
MAITAFAAAVPKCAPEYNGSVAKTRHPWRACQVRSPLRDRRHAFSGCHDFDERLRSYQNLVREGCMHALVSTSGCGKGQPADVRHKRSRSNRALHAYRNRIPISALLPHLLRRASGRLRKAACGSPGGSEPTQPRVLAPAVHSQTLASCQTMVPESTLASRICAHICTIDDHGQTHTIRGASSALYTQTTITLLS